MNEFINHFADAANEINQTIPEFINNKNIYQAGIGPYTEDRIVERVVNLLGNRGIIQNFHIKPNLQVRNQIGLSHYFGLNNNLATPDLVLNQSIIEFKICRPLRDNGDREDTWFKKVFEPNNQSYSTFLDVSKLCRFRDNYDTENFWNKWVVIIGFERQNETDYRLDNYFPNLFNFISTEIMNLPCSEFLSTTRDIGNRHPHHQILKLYAFKY